jgi:hypothetical protein
VTVLPPAVREPGRPGSTRHDVRSGLGGLPRQGHYLAAQFRRFERRFGTNGETKAIFAVAHTMIVIERRSRPGGSPISGDAQSSQQSEHRGVLVARERTRPLVAEAMSRLKPKPGGPLETTLTVGGNVAGEGQVPVSSSLLFTANDCLDVGRCLSSPVSLDTAKGTVTVQRHGSRMRVAHQ